jgi:thiamine biosynthesis lipoprotein
MGTTVIIKVYAEKFPAADRDALVKELRHMEDVFKRADTNDGEVRYLLREAERYEKASQGAFSPYVGALVRLWGFDREDAAFSRPPPAEADIRAALAKRELNLYALAKGYTVDHLARRLERMGYQHYIVNAGGDLVAKGSKGAVPWRVDVRHPRFTHRTLGQLKVDGKLAVATSGDYQNYFVHENVWYHHLLDARTGQPARRYQAVTVIANSVMEADALATAIFVSEGVIDLSHLRDPAVMVTTQDNRQVMTPAFQKRFITNCPPNDPCIPRAEYMELKLRQQKQP